jgi:Major Facilitator Superfamily
MINTSWHRIISLAILQGAISLTWLIYNIYLPQLLVSYGFPKELAITLLIVENAIAALLEPLLGSLSDRAFRWISTKFGFVSLGVILSSALFILIPAAVVFRDVFAAIKGIFPVLLILWAMAMTVFRSPAVSLIGRYAYASKLPLAMSFLTLAGGLVGAVKPVSQDFLLGLGAPVAFTIGSIVLLAATGLLRYFDPPNTIDPEVENPRPIPIVNIGKIIGLGLGIAWGARSLMETITKMLKLSFPQFNTNILVTIIALAIAISAIPAGIYATQFGNRRVMLVGVGATITGLIALVSFPTNIAITSAILLIVIALNLVVNGAIPLVLRLLPKDRSGLATGLYFGSFSAGISLFSITFTPVSKLTPTLGAVVGVVALILVGACVWVSREPTDRKRPIAPRSTT